MSEQAGGGGGGDLGEEREGHVGPGDISGDEDEADEGESGEREAARLDRPPPLQCTTTRSKEGRVHMEGGTDAGEGE